MKKVPCLTILISALAIGSSAYGGGKSEAAKAAKPGSQTIVEIVQADDGEFDVLEAAVVRAGLVDALNGKRQLTVFAPIDQAFIDLFEVNTEEEAIAEVEALDVDTLTAILLYHVTPGRRISTSVLAAPRYRTLNGKILSRGELVAAGIEDIDISASNGVVHVLGGVLNP